MNSTTRRATIRAAIVRDAINSDEVGRLLDSLEGLEREATTADLRAEIARFNGTSEGDIFARTVLEGALTAVRRGQAGRAGACGKPMEECGGSCWLPVGHADTCRCGGDTDGEGCPA